MSGVRSVGLNFPVQPASRNWQGQSAASHLISLGWQAELQRHPGLQNVVKDLTHHQWKFEKLN